MVCIRPANIDDLFGIQACNLQCLAENYPIKNFLKILVTSPQLCQVAVDDNKVVGYVLSRIQVSLRRNDPTEPVNGYITSIAVLRTFRKLGIASRLMQATMDVMEEMYSASCVTLHVRRSNRPALSLYSKSLGFEHVLLEPCFYMDQEDAFEMKKMFPKGLLEKGTKTDKTCSVRKADKTCFGQRCCWSFTETDSARRQGEHLKPPVVERGKPKNNTKIVELPIWLAKNPESPQKEAGSWWAKPNVFAQDF